MIQRVQTIHLLLAAIASFLLFLFPLWEADAELMGLQASFSFSIQDEPMLMVAATITGLISLLSIFLFRNRPFQMKMGWVNVILLAGLYGLIYFFSMKLDSPLSSFFDLGFKAGLLLPFFGIVFTILANIAIRKDDKLVRSMDRLR